MSMYYQVLLICQTLLWPFHAGQPPLLTPQSLHHPCPWGSQDRYLGMVVFWKCVAYKEGVHGSCATSLVIKQRRRVSSTLHFQMRSSLPPVLSTYVFRVGDIGEQPHSWVQKYGLDGVHLPSSCPGSGHMDEGRTVHGQTTLQHLLCTSQMGIQGNSNYGLTYVKNSHCAITCSFFPLFSSHSSGIQRTHSQQTFEATPGGGSGLWQLYEQGPKGKCIWLQSLQLEQNCRHQIQHRQVGQKALNELLCCCVFYHSNESEGFFWLFFKLCRPFKIIQHLSSAFNSKIFCSF